MPRRTRVNPRTLDPLIEAGRTVATHRELQEAGLSTSTIMRRISRTGPWQRVLPGVVAGHNGVLTQYEQRLDVLPRDVGRVTAAW